MSAWIGIWYVSGCVIKFNLRISTTTCLFYFLFYVFYIQKTGYEKRVAFLFYEIWSNLYSLSKVLSTNSLSLLHNRYILAFSDILDSQSDFTRIFIQFSSGIFVKSLLYQIKSYFTTNWDSWVTTSFQEW